MKTSIVNTIKKYDVQVRNRNGAAVTDTRLDLAFSKQENQYEASTQSHLLSTL